MPSSWTLPGILRPIVIENNFGVVTNRTIQFFNVAGGKTFTIKTEENITLAFSSSNLIGKNFTVKSVYFMDNIFWYEPPGLSLGN
jgi:hypothetical protein